MGKPPMKSVTQMTNATNLRCGNNFSGQLSTMPVMRDSTLQNSVSTPSTRSIAKNRMAQMNDPGKLRTNSG